MHQELTSEFSYTNPIDISEQKPSNEQRNSHIDIDNEPHIVGFTPRAPRQEVSLPEIEAAESFKPHKNISVSNIIWSILVGWWISLLYLITGIIFIITIYGYKHGLYCFKMALYIIYPFGKYVTKNSTASGPENFFTKLLWIILFPIYGIGSFLGAFISWELTYYIPMSKFLFKIIKLSLTEPTAIDIVELQNKGPQKDRFPTLLTHSSGSWMYFKFTLYSFEVPYLNMTPFIILALVCGFIGQTNNFISNPMFGSVVAMIGAIPCAYLIGICVDDLSHQMGLIIGSILNSSFLAIVELILYYFSLRKSDLSDVVRSAITGAFLMNLLIIPGVGMLAAGLKWNEVILNKKSQSISGTILMLGVVAVLFPSIFYHIHSSTIIECTQCQYTGDLNSTIASNISTITSKFSKLTSFFAKSTSLSIFDNISCSLCQMKEPLNYNEDPVYKEYTEKLMWSMTAVMPIIYIIGVIFSLKTHPQIFVYESKEEGENSGMNKWVAIVLLLISTIAFSLMAHVMTDKIPEAIEELNLSPRFVGLVFYTLIPNAAEYMNAIKFALNGNIGLSMEIGNQGALLTSMIELPVLVVMSHVLHKIYHTVLFTLVFPVIDVCAVLISTFLRNSILIEKSVNYLTGVAFLIIFLLISILYFFEI